MAQFKKGDMFSVFNISDHFLITTNAIIKKNGGLVMGAGIAKTCRDRWPGLDVKLGTAIKQNGPEYGVILGRKLGIFQVKHHFKDAADLELIAASARKLAVIAAAQKDERFDLNFPGIGNGKRSYAEVKPLLDILPDNVYVWTFK